MASFRQIKESTGFSLRLLFGGALALFSIFLLSFVIVQQGLVSYQQKNREVLLPLREARRTLEQAANYLVLRQSNILAATSAKALAQLASREGLEQKIAFAESKLDEKLPVFVADERLIVSLTRHLTAVLISDDAFFYANLDRHQHEEAFSQTYASLEEQLDRFFASVDRLLVVIRSLEGFSRRTELASELRTTAKELMRLSGKIGLVGSDDQLAALVDNQLVPTRDHLQQTMGELQRETYSNPAMQRILQALTPQPAALAARIFDRGNGSSLASLRSRIFDDSKRIQELHASLTTLNTQVATEVSALRSLTNEVTSDVASSLELIVTLASGALGVIGLIGFAGVIFGSRIIRRNIHLLDEQNTNLVRLQRNLTEVNATLEEKIEARTAEVAKQQAMIANAAKFSALGEMAGGMAHEINTPLAVIKMRANQLTRLVARPDFDPQAIRGMTQVIEATADRIAKIVQGLRTFSRNAEADPLTPERLQTIIDDTLELCSERLSNSGITLSVQVDPGVVVNCRPAQIAQVLLNLLVNASDATTGQSERWIKLEAKEELGDVVVCISDSGPGLSPEIRAKLFQPFFTTKPVGKGTGLGLSISKAIIEDHGGSLVVDFSRNWTCFAMRLPRVVPAGAQPSLT